MPVFEVQTDNGTFQIDAPDQNSALSALGSLPTGPENSLAGSAKAIGTGLADGVIGLAGLPADATDLLSRGVDYLAGTKSHDKIGPAVQPFGSENIRKKVEGYTGEFPKPQTDTEKYLHSIAGFAPALLGGPETLLAKIGTRMIAPGVASEAAGQMAEGTGYEPVARVAGALGGAVGASKLASAAAAPKIAAVPTAAENAALKSNSYKSQAIKDLEINPTYANKVADSALAKIERFSEKNPEVAEVKDLLGKLRKPQVGYTHSIDTDFDGTRQLLQGIAGKGGSGGEAARLAVKTIDAATLRIPTSYVIAGDARAASRDMFTARKAAAVEFREQRVSEALQVAVDRAATAHSGGNLENTIYQEINKLLKDKKALRGWTSEERATLRAVLPGHTASGVRRAGKLLGGGGGLGQLASGAAGTAMFGPAGMIALPALGFGLNKLGSTLATGRLNNVSETLRARSPLYGKANMAQRQQALSGGILQGLPQREQLALQALIAARQQSPEYAGR